MYKIKTMNSISDVIYDYLDKANYQISSDVADEDGILVRSAKLHDMPLGENLKAIARAGAGVNNIPIDACTEKGIVVFNTPGANANAVKELVLAALLISSRNVIPAVAWAQGLKGKGAEVPALVEKGKGEFVGPELKGKKLGVIGLGAIGAMVANDARALGMEVFGYDPFISVEAAWGLSRSVRRATDLDSVLAQCDYVTIHIPLMEKTKNFLSADKFQKMKKGAVILNFSRGELVNSTDLLQAIADGQISHYVTDFPTDEMIGVVGVTAIPHLGASTPESEENCAMMAAIEINDYLENGNICNSVNYPDCELPRAEDFRITMMHQNVAGMVGQMTAVLGDEKINIANMVNKSRGNVAYTVIDTDSKLTDTALAKIKAIEGIIRVRTFG